jgi:hypothetical protein
MSRERKGEATKHAACSSSITEESVLNIYWAKTRWEWVRLQQYTQWSCVLCSHRTLPSSGTREMRHVWATGDPQDSSLCPTNGELNSFRKVSLKFLGYTHLGEQFCALIETGSTLPSSQNSRERFYPKLVEPNPHHHTLYLWRFLYIVYRPMPKLCFNKIICTSYHSHAYLYQLILLHFSVVVLFSEVYKPWSSHHIILSVHMLHPLPWLEIFYSPLSSQAP